MKYATIRLYNERGYSTETCIVYSDAELKERLRFYRNQGYASHGYGRHYEVS